MRALPHTPETEALARRLVWFEPPEISLANTARLIAYALEGATHAEMQLLRRFVSDDELRMALDAIPPGIVRPRSWVYWNARLGRYPAPPLPTRRIG